MELGLAIRDKTNENLILVGAMSTKLGSRFEKGEEERGCRGSIRVMECGSWRRRKGREVHKIGLGWSKES